MNTSNINFLKVASKSETVNTNSVIAGNLTVVVNQARSFSTADMWNIQRHVRTSLMMRRRA